MLFINGERIEYFVKDGNSLQQLRRGTMGTGVKDIHSIGDELFDSKGSNRLCLIKIQPVNTFHADGSTTEFTIDFNANPVNEFEVFVGGKRPQRCNSCLIRH